MSETPAPLRTRFSERFGLRYPFASAPMAFAGGTAPMCNAVCAAGGVGAVGVVGEPFVKAESLRGLIRSIKAAVEGPFNVNFITCFPHAAHVDLCIEEGVPVVSFHWGHPDPAVLNRLRDAGISVWEQVGDAEAAKRAAGDGVEVVIAQGWEAGGHNYGGLPTFVLVPTIVDAIPDTMVLAAGGVMDGRGAAAALALGASGVWVGTRLVASREANVHAEHHRRLLEARGEETVRSSIFGPEWPHFNPMRLHRNRVVAEWNERLSDVPTERDTLPEIGRTVFDGEAMIMRKFNVVLPTPETTGDFEEMPWLMGQGAGMVRSIEPAGAIVERMMTEAAELLGALGQGRAGR